MKFRPKKDWSVGDLRNLVSSISTIYNVFYIINNRDKDGVRKFLMDLGGPMQNEIQIFPELDAYLDNNGKLMIDHIEMGSPEEFEVLTYDNKTGNDTKEFLKGNITPDGRIDDSDVGDRIRVWMKKALTKAIDVIKRLEDDEKLENVKENID
jgi:hypothetical protein